MAVSSTAEHQFYSRYAWCLNPVLPLHQLIYRFIEELHAYSAYGGWQREEIKINLYLFACAIACTADDYFNLRPLDLSSLWARLPRIRLLLIPAQWVLNTGAFMLKVILNWRAWRWRRRWNSCIEDVCNLLLGGPELRITQAVVPRARLPERLLRWKMRLPEAFRGQDFTHHDVVALIQRFCACSAPTDQPITIVGLRTAGAYFAPLMAAHLKRSNCPRVSWFSIRPKNGVSTWERWQFRSLRRQNSRVLMVDDYPATGSTLHLTLKILQEFKIKPEQISLLAPTHAAQPNWTKLVGIDPAISVFTVHPSELFKWSLLKPESVESWCAEYFRFSGSQGFRVVSNKDVDELNTRLAEHSKDGHHVREKRVFEIQLTNQPAPQRKKILLKSVGWGWLGYHAFIAGKRLEGFVPRVIGLRNGLLIMEWIDAMREEPNVKSDELIGVLASYVAARATKLRLAGDFQFETRSYRWTGVDEIVTILRAAYGPYLSRLKGRHLRKELYKYVTAVPTLIDGKMSPEEWVHAPGFIRKSDFEHHNFGGAEPDIADPAYDLAAAVFEFQLTKESEEELLGTYLRLTGDRTIRDRIIVHKILYASMAMRHAADRVSAGEVPEENHHLYHRARNFLIYSMIEFCSSLINVRRNLQWSDSLFFIDLDGVFDQDILGFPHATYSGLQSLMLLQANRCSVVLNTGRGVEHVRKYCDVYGIQGGVAEFGSVFVDAVQKKDIPLIDDEAAAQLAKCRVAIRALPGVFIDPAYKYSIRAYRFKGRAQVGLPTEEIRVLLNNPDFNRLSSIPTGVDMYIVQNGTNKGTGVSFVKRYLNNNTSIVAIGHSDQDVPMLALADHAYALANCSAAVRELAKRGRCQIVKKRCQSGLLQAIKDRLEHNGFGNNESLSPPALQNRRGNLMSDILRAADRQPILRFF
jgi:hydroxymethylpyrimidine pyrophosphatase-like HAD family hydrolase